MSDTVAAPDTDAPTRVELLRFTVGGGAYAFESGRVASVRVDIEVTDIPGSGPAVVGAATIDGETVVVVDARTLFDTDDQGPGATLVLDRGTGERPVGLVVDAPPEVETHGVERFATVSEAAAEGWAPPMGTGWFRAAVEVDPWLGVLDVERLVSRIDE